MQIKASAADLRPLHRAMTGQPGTAPPITASAIVGFAGYDVSLTDLGVAAGKSSVRGRLDLKLARPFDISGDIAADDLGLAAASALLFGLPSVAPASSTAWSHEPIGAGAFGEANGAVTFKLDRAALTPAWVVRDLKGVVRLQPAQIALSDLDGNFAGGRLNGEIAVSHDARGLCCAGAHRTCGRECREAPGARQSSRRPPHGEAARRQAWERLPTRLSAHSMAVARFRSTMEVLPGSIRRLSMQHPCGRPGQRDRAAENPGRGERRHG